MLYTGENRGDFRVTKVSVVTIPDPDPVKVLIAYSGKQVLEEFALTKDRFFADEIKRQLNTALMATPDSDEMFWETWDYYYKCNKIQRQGLNGPFSFNGWHRPSSFLCSSCIDSLILYCAPTPGGDDDEDDEADDYEEEMMIVTSPAIPKGITITSFRVFYVWCLLGAQLMFGVCSVIDKTQKRWEADTEITPI